MSTSDRKDPHETKTGRSLLKQQMAILGYVGGPMDEATRREKERMAGLKLAPLDLPGASAPVWSLPKRRSPWRPMVTLGGMLGVFAALVLFVLRFDLPWSGSPSSDTLRVKGESKIWVYWERQGEVLQLEPGAALQNGDRIRAEVLAAEDVVGYLAVRGESGVLLGRPEQVLESKLSLKAGDKATFSGSVKLVGEDEGEKLLVILCGANATIDLSAVFPGDRQPVDLTGLPGGCSAQEFPLR